MEFRAEVESNGKTATGIEAPAEVVEALGAGRRPAVSVTLHGHRYRTSIASVGGPGWTLESEIAGELDVFAADPTIRTAGRP